MCNGRIWTGNKKSDRRGYRGQPPSDVALGTKADAGVNEIGPAAGISTLSFVPHKENLMSFEDKAKNKAEEMQGKGKETVGQATDDDELKAEGKADQTKSNLKQAGEKVKDIFK